MGLPKRWLPYTNFGKPIPGTRFVALKCPLRPNLCQQLPDDKKFTPDLVLELIPKLRMIIDLTFTSKYYTPEVFMDAGLRHVKLLCEGHNVPNRKVVNQFFKEVDNFVDETSEGLIGVHCTHGVNRTGYLICKYMITKLGFQPEEAIKAFGEARGHPIERVNYLCSLGLSTRLAETLSGEEPRDMDAKQESNRGIRDYKGGQNWQQPRNGQQRQGSWGQGQQKQGSWGQGQQRQDSWGQGQQRQGSWGQGSWGQGQQRQGSWGQGQQRQDSRSQGQQKYYWQDQRKPPQFHGPQPGGYNNYSRPPPNYARYDDRRDYPDARRDSGNTSAPASQHYQPPSRGAWGPPRNFTPHRPRWDDRSQPQHNTSRKTEQQKASLYNGDRPAIDREIHKKRREENDQDANHACSSNYFAKTK